MHSLIINSKIKFRLVIEKITYAEVKVFFKIPFISCKDFNFLFLRLFFLFVPIIYYLIS